MARLGAVAAATLLAIGAQAFVPSGVVPSAGRSAKVAAPKVSTCFVRPTTNTVLSMSTTAEPPVTPKGETYEFQAEVSR